MGKKIIWSPAAEGDLENVLDFLDTKWSSRIALRFLKKLDNVIELISEDPKLFPLIHKKMGVVGEKMRKMEIDIFFKGKYLIIDLFTG